MATENKTLRNIALVIIALLLLFGASAGGFVAGSLFTQHRQKQTLPTEVLLPDTSSETETEVQPSPADAETEQLFQPFWETWDLLHTYYVDQPLDDVALMRGAIRGMLASLGDPHTSYMDPQELQDANAVLSGEYEGIGAWVDTSGDYLTIVTPMKDSPAEKAGLQPGDAIIAVDGEDVYGISPEVVRQKVLGPAGSQVTLTIQREGVEDPFDVVITRGKITVPSVESKMLDDNIAYVRLNTFGDKTAQELEEQLGELLEQNPDGIILDLRNNGGGYLMTAVEVASQFISEGIVLSEQYGDGQMQVYNIIPGGMATDIPIVVLVNEGTASASEIVAGAIQDHGRGTLVGAVTYGKGSVQNWIPLDDEAGAVRITIARWLTPNGRTIDKEGLTPDVIVEISEEDYQNNRDPQLEKAIEILRQNQP